MPFVRRQCRLPPVRTQSEQRASSHTQPTRRTYTLSTRRDGVGRGTAKSFADRRRIGRKLGVLSIAVASWMLLAMEASASIQAMLAQAAEAASRTGHSGRTGHSESTDAKSAANLAAVNRQASVGHAASRMAETPFCTAQEFAWLATDRGTCASPGAASSFGATAAVVSSAAEFDRTARFAESLAVLFSDGAASHERIASAIDLAVVMSPSAAEAGALSDQPDGYRLPVSRQTLAGTQRPSQPTGSPPPSDDGQSPEGFVFSQTALLAPGSSHGGGGVGAAASPGATSTAGPALVGEIFQIIPDPLLVRIATADKLSLPASARLRVASSAAGLRVGRQGCVEVLTHF